MTGNAELLNYIYQNAQMGVDTIGHLREIVQDSEFRKHLDAQYQGYQDFHREAKEKLNSSGFDEKGLNALEKLRTYLTINLETLSDKSVSHIAEMMMIGSNMGIVNAIKNIKKYKDAEPDILLLMEKLERFEEDNLQQLKKFL